MRVIRSTLGKRRHNRVCDTPQPIQSTAELPGPVIATGAGAAWLGGKAATIGGTAALTGTALGMSNGIITGAFTAGAAALTTAVLALPAALTAAAALTMTYDQANKIAIQEGSQAFIGKADAGEAPALNPMEGLVPKDPPFQKYLRTPFSGTFGNWEGSLPPGTAGMPASVPARLPGLNGLVGPRPSKAPKSEVMVRQPGFGPATPKDPADGSAATGGSSGRIQRGARPGCGQDAGSDCSSCLLQGRADEREVGAGREREPRSPGGRRRA